MKVLGKCSLALAKGAGKYKASFPRLCAWFFLFSSVHGELLAHSRHSYWIQTESQRGRGQSHRVCMKEKQGRRRKNESERNREGTDRQELAKNGHDFVHVVEAEHGEHGLKWCTVGNKINSFEIKT